MSKGANRKYGSFQVDYRGPISEISKRDLSLTEALGMVKRLLEENQKEVKVVRE